MKSVFEAQTREELLSRISCLSVQHKALWGKMDVYQMVKHSALCDDMFFGTLVIERVWIGRLIGKMVLKKVLKDGSPFKKNSPTSPLLVTTSDNGDLEKEKEQWAKRIAQYSYYNNPSFVHPFFGPMTKEQVGQLAYKHADHHLRQFGA